MKTVILTLTFVFFHLVNMVDATGYTVTIGQPSEWRAVNGGNDHWYQLCVFHYSSGETFQYSHLEDFAESQIHIGHPGYLVTITSIEENRYLGFGEYFLGLHRSDVWRWVGGPEEGEEPVFTKWGTGEPDLADCAYITGSEWSDKPCEWLFETDDTRRILVEYGGLTRYDCNENGIDDRDEIANHPSLDFNGDGILDECQPGVAAVEIGDVPNPGTILHDPFPNPFNPQTTIAFNLSRQTIVSLRVFDVSGRLVRVLLEGHLIGEGRHEAVWDGRNDSGSQLASGTYFYNLEAGAFSETKRMTMLK